MAREVQARSRLSGRFSNRRAVAVELVLDEAERRPGGLSTPHTLRHEAILGRAVQRLALRTHRLASAGVSLALLDETRLGGTVERLAGRTHRLALAGLCRCRTDREAGNQRRQDNASHQLVLHLLTTQANMDQRAHKAQRRPSVIGTEASVSGLVQRSLRAGHLSASNSGNSTPALCFTKGLKTGYCR
jgi:hypothetical protein